MIIKYSKTNSFGTKDSVQTPIRANPSDAGLDVFYTGEDLMLKCGENRLFSTGLKFEIPHGYMLQVCNRSSMGAKKSLIVGAHIIDSGYDGEVFIDLHNIGNQSHSIMAGQKIAQLVMVPIVPFRLLLVKEDDLYSEDVTISSRGAGALGSTGK